MQKLKKLEGKTNRNRRLKAYKRPSNFITVSYATSLPLINSHHYESGDLHETWSVEKQAHSRGGLQRKNDMGMNRTNHAVETQRSR
jgi:hypothetical protein